MVVPFEWRGDDVPSSMTHTPGPEPRVAFMRLSSVCFMVSRTSARTGMMPAER